MMDSTLWDDAIALSGSFVIFGVRIAKKSLTLINPSLNEHSVKQIMLQSSCIALESWKWHLAPPTPWTMFVDVDWRS